MLCQRSPIVPAQPAVADVGTGPPVLLLHGQPGVGSDWDGVAGALMEDHRVLAPDRPGYGAGAAAAISLSGNVDALVGMLSEREVDPVVAVGHSYGGAVAILLAARHPELVRGLVLAGSVGPADSLAAADRLLALPFVGGVLTAAGLYTFGRMLPRLRRQVVRAERPAMDWLVASLPDERYRSITVAQSRRLCCSVVEEQRALLREIDDVDAAMSTVHVPTVVVTGTWDIVVPPSVAARLAAAVPGAELVTVSRTGHFLPRDQPALLADVIRRVEQRALTG